MFIQDFLGSHGVLAVDAASTVNFHVSVSLSACGTPLVFNNMPPSNTTTFNTAALPGDVPWPPVTR